MKKILILLLVIAVAMSIASCGKKKNQNDKQEPSCTNHTDANDDLLCDNCGVSFDDGEEAPAPTLREITFIVELKQGGTLSDVKFTLNRGEKSYNLVTGADGSVKYSLELGAYSIACDPASLPENHSVETRGFKITDTSNSVVKIIVMDESLDGSAEKPFWVNEEGVEHSFAAGETLHFTVRGSGEKILKINSSDVVVAYGDKNNDGEVDTYLPEGGSVVVPIDQKDVKFSVTNTSSASITITLMVEIPLGSIGNPIVLESTSQSVSVTKDTSVHYKWVADKSGVLVLTTTSKNSNISVTRYITMTVDNNGVEETIIVPHMAQTDGASAVYSQVKEGEEIMIAVSSMEATDTVVDFALNIYAGTDADPIPVLVDKIDIYVDADSQLVFTSQAGKSVYVKDDQYVSIVHDGITYTNSDGNEISFKLVKPTFALSNTGKEANGLVIEIK